MQKYNMKGTFFAMLWVILCVYLPVAFAGDCADPGSLANGQRTIEGFNDGDTATYSCNPGYVLHTGAATHVRTCTSSIGGSFLWSQSVPLCSKITCGDPGDANFADKTGSYEFEEVVTYTCQHGYTKPDLTDITTMTCQEDGTWSGTLVDCQRIQCIEPEDMPNSVHSPSGPYYYGDMVEYECDLGFGRVSGDYKMWCQTSTFWNGTYLECGDVSCGDPGRPASSDRLLSGIGYLDTVTYTCRPGYVYDNSTGALNQVCQQDSTWSSTQPVCRGIYCSDPGERNNSTRTASSYRYPENIIYTCDTGYKPDYSILGTKATVRCQADGNWDFDPINCIKVTCTDADPPENVVIDNSQYHYQEVKTYVCSEGFEMTSGDASRTCTDGGTFTGVAPVCERKRCTDPGTVSNSFRNVSGLQYGDIITYNCNKGFVIVRENTKKKRIMVCQADQQWSKPAPACTRVHCGEADYGLNVQVSVAGGVFYGDEWEFVCDYGHEPYLGNMTRSCLSSGAWSGKAPHCIAKACPNPGWVDKTIRIGTILRYQEKMYYICEPGFEKATGDDFLQCEADGTWSGNKPTCTKIQCSRPDTIANAQWTGNSFYFQDSVNYTCDYGYEWEPDTGALNRSCEADKQWSTPKPICGRISCGDPGEVNNTYKVGAGYKLGDVVNFTCALGHESTTRNAWSAITCMANGTWMGAGDSVECNPVYCGDPGYTNDTLQSRTIDGFYYKMTVKYSCIPGYILDKRYSTITCIETKEWDREIPDCIYSPDVGLMPEVVPASAEAPTESENAKDYGMVGVSLFIVIGSFCVLLDLSTLWRDIKILKRNLTDGYSRIKDYKQKREKQKKLDAEKPKKIKKLKVKVTPVDAIPSVGGSMQSVSHI